MNRSFTKEKKVGLVNEILNELLESAKFLGESFSKSIIFNEEDTIIILDSNKDFQREYSLSEVSFILKDRVDGLWVSDKSLIEYVNYLEEKLEEKYESFDKYEFLAYCKKVYNLKYKTEIAYFKLREIEKMV